MAQQNKRQSTWPDVWLSLIDKSYNLINTGNFVGLVIFCAIVYGLVLVIKYPNEDLPHLLRGFASLLMKEKFYLFPIGGALAVSVISNIYQHRIYKSEIRRVSKTRSDVIHGKRNLGYQEIDEHRSSGGEE